MTLYVPGPVLREGKNEVVLLEVELGAGDTPGSGQGCLRTRLAAAGALGCVQQGPCTPPFLRSLGATRRARRPPLQ